MKIHRTTTLAIGALYILAINQPTTAENSDDSNIQLVRGKRGGGGGGRGGGGRHVGGHHRGGHHGKHHRGGHHRGHHHGGQHRGHHHGGHYHGGGWGVGAGVAAGALGTTIINQYGNQCQNTGYDEYGNLVCYDYNY